jgi:hypothetical protein
MSTQLFNCYDLHKTWPLLSIQNHFSQVQNFTFYLLKINFNINIQTFIHTCIHTYMCACIHTYVCVWIHTHKTFILTKLFPKYRALADLHYHGNKCLNISGNVITILPGFWRILHARSVTKQSVFCLCTDILSCLKYSVIAYSFNVLFPILSIVLYEICYVQNLYSLLAA